MSTALIAGTPHSNPLYEEVRDEITRGLERGEWKHGELIPSEADLAKRFGVSKGTVRRALDELVTENILVRRQGRSTFVATHTRDRTHYHFFRLIGRDGSRELPDAELLSYRVVRGTDEACDPVKSYLAAHAVVRKQNATGTWRTETAWGDGERIVQKGSWAEYFNMKLEGKEEVDPPPPPVNVGASSVTTPARTTRKVAMPPAPTGAPTVSDPIVTLSVTVTSPGTVTLNTIPGTLAKVSLAVEAANPAETDATV